jgi:transposase InsO family protein
MAIVIKNANSLIHYFILGIQYICKDYTKILKDNDIRITKSEKGNPYDKVIAQIIIFNPKTGGDEPIGI